MKGWRERLITAPTPVLFVYFAVIFGGLTFLIPEPPLPRSAGLAIFDGLFFGVCMTTWAAIMRRRDRASAGDRADTDRLVLARALNSGTLPEDPTLDPTIARLIERRRRQNRWAMKTGPWLFGVAALVSVIIALTEAEPVWFLYAAFFIGVMLWSHRSSNRIEQRFRSLEAQLQDRGP
jgi:hypothetical protein